MNVVYGKSPSKVDAASGYDWLLNKCVDLDQAAHAAHLDEGERHSDCFNCTIGEGRP